MTDLISNVLDLTRLESGEVVLRRDWQTLDDLAARRAAVDSDERARAHQFVIDLAPDLPEVHVDAALIVQVFGNLFDNVVKYTPAGRARACRPWPTAPFVRVTVDDDGPGLPGGRSGAAVREVPARRGRARDRGRRASGSRSAARSCSAHGGDI